MYCTGSIYIVVDSVSDETGAHIVRHDPASVMRGCAADRKTLAAVQRWIDGHPGEHTNEDYPQDDSCDLCVEWNKTTLSPYALTFVAERYGLEVDGG